MTAIKLDARLARETFVLGQLSFCQILLMDDCRWPWLTLVPQREALVELHDLSPSEVAAVASDIVHASIALKSAAGALKINTAALGNIVRQLHVHVVARNQGDENWPGPVWGNGSRLPYGPEAKAALLARLVPKLFATEAPQ